MLRYKPEELQNVWLANGYEFKPSGRLFVKDRRQLHTQVANILIENQPLLNGTEFRFIREGMGLTSAIMSEVFDVSPRQIGAWEKGPLIEAPIARLLRIFYLDEMGAQELSILETARKLPKRDGKNGLKIIMEINQGSDGTRWSRKVLNPIPA